MATKPTTLPLWATDGGTTLEPSLGQKQAGFAANTKAPARWVNWLLNNVYTWIQYLDAPTGTGAGSGFEATGGSSGGTGLKGTGGASGGTGVHGVSASGYGVVAEGDTTSPAKAALRIVPQDADPSSSPAKGDAYNATTGGRTAVHDGNVWNRLLGKVFAATSTTDTRTSTGAFAQTFTIPANTLRVGSVVRIRAGFKLTAFTSGDALYTVSFGNSNPVGSTVTGRTGSTSDFAAIEAVVTVRTLGGSGSMSAGGIGLISDASSAGAARARADIFTVDTTAGIVVQAACTLSGTATARLEYLVIDISD